MNVAQKNPFSDLLDVYKPRFHRFDQASNLLNLSRMIFNKPKAGRNQVADLHLTLSEAKKINDRNITAHRIDLLISQLYLPFLPLLPLKMPADILKLVICKLDPEKLKAWRLTCRAWRAAIKLEDLFLSYLTHQTRMVRSKPFPPYKYIWENILSKQDALQNPEKPDSIVLMNKLLRIFFLNATKDQLAIFYGLKLKVFSDMKRLIPVLPASLETLCFHEADDAWIKFADAIRDHPTTIPVNSVRISAHFADMYRMTAENCQRLFSLRPPCLVIDGPQFLQKRLRKLPAEQFKELTSSIKKLIIRDFMERRHLEALQVGQLKEFPAMPDVQELTLSGRCFDPDMQCQPVLTGHFPHVQVLEIEESTSVRNPMPLFEQLTTIVKGFPELRSLNARFRRHFKSVATLNKICELMKATPLLEKMSFTLLLQKNAYYTLLEEGKGLVDKLRESYRTQYGLTLTSSLEHGPYHELKLIKSKRDPDPTVHEDDPPAKKARKMKSDP